jgi:hypothetical protein
MGEGCYGPAVRFGKPLLVGLLALGYLVSAALALSLLRLGQFGYDVYAYWSVDLGHLYATDLPTLGDFGAFHYAPAVAQVFALFHGVPWYAFLFGYEALLVGTLIWLGWRWTPLLFAFPPLILELYAGNINLLLAAAIALGMRYPAAWAFVLLTKVTPGVGVLWFAARREWRHLGIAVGATALIVAVSFAIAPSLWSEWFTALTTLQGQAAGEIPIPLLLRLPIAAAVVWWGAMTDRRWAVPAAAVIATPVLWIGWPAWLVVLFAVLPIVRWDRSERAVIPSASEAADTVHASDVAEAPAT